DCASGVGQTASEDAAKAGRAFAGVAAETDGVHVVATVERTDRACEVVDGVVGQISVYYTANIVFAKNMFIHLGGPPPGLLQERSISGNWAKTVSGLGCERFRVSGSLDGDSKDSCHCATAY